MARDNHVPLGLYSPSDSKLKSYNTISDMIRDGSLMVDQVVNLLGYYKQGDGATHKRIIANEDDGSGVQLNNGLWANIVHNGEVNVSWFGAKGDGVTDDTQAIQKALYICLKPQIFFTERDNRNSTTTLQFSTKKYIINGKIKLDIHNVRTRNLLINGNDCLLVFKGTECLINNDKIYNIHFKNVGFLVENSEATLFYSVSNGGAQRYCFTRCSFDGEMKYGINLKGGDNNSEFKFDYCSFSGTWVSFLNASGENISNQFLNYWFANCIYWSSSQWIHLETGGHVKLVDCDISGYAPRTKTYLFYLRGSSDGVQTFLDKGSRYELKSNNACVIDYSSDLMQVVFEGSDFSSNVSFNYIIEDCFNFYTATQNSVIITFKECKLTGKFRFTGNTNTLANCNFINCNFYVGNILKDNFNIVIGANVSRTWELIFENCNFKNKNFCAVYPLNKANGFRKEYIVNMVSPFNNITKDLVAYIPFPTFVRANFEKRHAFVGIEFNIAVISQLGKVKNKTSKNIEIEITNGANVFIGNKLISNTKKIYTVISKSVNTITLDQEFTEDNGSNIALCLLDFKTMPNETINEDNAIISSDSTYLVAENISLIDLNDNVQPSGFAGGIELIINSKIIKPFIASPIQKLNTQYMATKMQQEGVYGDFIDYMDSKIAYDKQQQKLERDKMLAYEEELKQNPNLTYEEFISLYSETGRVMLPSEEIKEPEPSEKLKAFMEKYL